MRYRATPFFLAAGLLLAGCTQPNGQPAAENGTLTTLEGGGFGMLTGAAVGFLAGGTRGMLIGAAAGAAVGTAGGLYVAHEKSKYTSIDQRISGEKELAQQSIATANAQIAASQAQKHAIDRQLAELEASQADAATKATNATALIGRLQTQNSQLTSAQKQMQTNISDQQAMISATEEDLAKSPDPQKQQAVNQWKAQIPQMKTALAAMTQQINEVSAEESKVETVPGCCNA